MKINNTEYEIQLKGKKKRILGINYHKGNFNNRTQQIQPQNKIILYGEKIDSQTFWHEIVHTIFAELSKDNQFERLSLKVYPNEKMIDKIADMIYEVNNQVKNIK